MNAEPQPVEDELGAFSLDSVLEVVKRRWPWLLVCAAFGATAAFYVAAKQGYAYEKTARILLRDEDQKNSGSASEVLLLMGLNQQGVNMANESYVVKSTELMMRVVQNLKLNVSVWRLQDIRQIDLYNESPIAVEFPEIDELREVELSLSPVDDKRYLLSYEETDGKQANYEGKFGVVGVLPFGSILVQPTTSFNETCFNEDYVIRRVSVRQAAENFLEVLNVTRPDAKESSLIELSLVTSNPRKASDVLNQLIREYNIQSIEEKRLAARKAEEFIIDRLGVLGGELGSVDKRIFDFRKDKELIVDMSSTFNANFVKIQELDQEAFEINTQIKQADVLKNMLSSQKDKRRMLSVNLGIDDSNIARQIEQYNETFLKYQELAESAGSKNPLVTALVNNMDAMLATLRRSIDNYRDALSLRLGEISKNKEGMENKMVSDASSEEALIPMLREQKVKEELYIMLLGKREENALSLATTEPSARVLEAAFGSDLPIAPRTKLFVLGGAAGGAALGLILFLGAVSMNMKIKTKQDLQGLTSIPVVGEFPELSRQEQKSGALFIPDGRNMMAECFHILRNNLERLVPGGGNSQGLVLLVTSTMPGEGKTFTSANLAQAFAATGKKTLLIDGDLRRGSLSHRLKARHQPGFSNLLLDHSKNPASCVMKPDGGHAQLDFLPSGPLPPNPVTLLTHPHFSVLLDHWKQRYDRIVIDTPPFGVLADTPIIAALSDITLYVIRGGMLDKRFLATLQQLADKGSLGRNCAFSLNDIDFKQARYRYYGYGYSYKYGSSSSAEKNSAKSQATSTPRV